MFLDIIIFLIIIKKIFGGQTMIFLLMVFLFSINVHAEYKGDVFLGYNQSKGNTDKVAASLTTEIKKLYTASELSFKTNIFYSEAEGNKDGQKVDSLAKYSFDIGKEAGWFNFYQVLFDHDYFSDIDYRITPSFGFGYHIFKTEEFIWDADAGFGYRVTRYIKSQSNNDEVLTSLLHTYLKKKAFKDAFLSEDFTAYPALKEDSSFILKSETTFSNRLSSSLDLELKYIINYDSKPSDDKKTTDTQILVGVKYKF